MPPLRTYTFTSELNNNIQVVIKAHSFEEAWKLLVILVKDTLEFTK